MKIQDYIRLIQSEFSYLFKDYSFSIVHQKVGGPNDDWFLVGLESTSNRILFERERGAGGMFLGTRASPFFSNAAGPMWFPAMNLLGYFLKKAPDENRLQGVPFAELPRAGMALYANELKPHLKQLLEMVSSPETIAKWNQNYIDYWANIAQKRYPGFQKTG